MKYLKYRQKWKGHRHRLLLDILPRVATEEQRGLRKPGSRRKNQLYIVSIFLDYYPELSLCRIYTAEWQDGCE
jgi:hypothetical protein